jgi:hypothetical protein
MRLDTRGDFASLKNQAGSALIMVLVAAAIGAIVSATMAMLIANLQTGANGVKFRTDANEVTDEMRVLLNSTANCTKSFGGTVVNPTAPLTPYSFNTLQNSLGATVFQVGGTYADKTVTIDSMTLSKYIPGATPDTAQMTLTTTFKSAKQALGPQIVPRTINIAITKDAGNALTSCQTLAASGGGDGLWKISSANPNNIFYKPPQAGAQGWVGIGTDDPAKYLEIRYDQDYETAVRLSNYSGGTNTWAQFEVEVQGSAVTMGVRGPGYPASAANPIFGDLFSNGTYLLGYTDLIVATEKPGSVLKFGVGNALEQPIEKMRIDSNGNVGIGIKNPTYLLQLGTDSAAKPGTSTWTIASDARLKDVRAPFTRGLAAIEEIHPIYFNYKKGNALDLPSDKEFVGIIAQDAEKAVPEAVNKDDKGFLHLTNDAIIWTLLNAVKELHQQFKTYVAKQLNSNSALEEKTEKLEKENKQLKERLDRLEKLLDSNAKQNRKK